MPWLPDPHDDQHLAGGILWGSGDLVGLCSSAVLFVQWVRVVDGARPSARTAGWTGSSGPPRSARPSTDGGDAPANR